MHTEMEKVKLRYVRELLKFDEICGNRSRIKMSTVGAGLGLTLAAAGILFIVMPVVKDQMLQTMVESSNSSNITYRDQNGSSVQFVLFTRNNGPHNMKLGMPGDFRMSGFNVKNPTKLIIHGFTSSINADVFLLLKNAYLQSGDYNVIGVDWSTLCENEYLSSIRGARTAGEIVSKFIRWLNKMGTSLRNVHIVGHSLGAHVSGIAGNKLKGTVGRITGLDPAGPGYSNIPESDRLDAGDAKLVDVIHTFAKVLSLAQPQGHVDFYPNGGRLQPGCPNIYDVWKVAESMQCNHARAYHLFAESIINPRAFKSKRCKSVDDAISQKCFEDNGVYMGQANTYKNGFYYVKTKAEKPYSLT